MRANRSTILEHAEVRDVSSSTKSQSESLDQRMLGIMAAFAVVWGILCLIGFTLNYTTSSESLVNQYSSQQISYIEDTPAWVAFARAMNVIGLLCGAVYLLLRKKSAYHWFTISLVGTLMTMVDSFIRDGFNTFGGIETGINLGMVIVGIFLFWASYSAFYEGQLED